MTTYLTIVTCPICKADATAASRHYCPRCLRIVCAFCFPAFGWCVECEGEGCLVPPDRAA